MTTNAETIDPEAAVARDPTPSGSPGDTDERLRRTAGREHELWRLIYLVSIVLSAGFIVLAATISDLRNSEYLVLLLGFATLTTILTIYLGRQRRTIEITRTALLQQLVRAEALLAESFMDPLTGLFNRRYMDYLVVLESKRADRNDGTFSIIMIDVNDFKTVNDRFGHLEGDRFLKHVAQVLKDTFRQTDTLIRYGGDEFLVMLPDTNEGNTQTALRRLRENVASWNVYNAVEYRMRLSWGIANYEPGQEVETVLALADSRMYGHKSVQKTCTSDPADVTVVPSAT